MKTKPKNFGNFFVRVGAGFLAFWLLSMGAFHSCWDSSARS